MVHWRRFCVILNCCSTSCEFKKKNQTYFIRLPFPNISMNSLPDMIEETCKVTWRCQSSGCSLPPPKKIRIRSVLCDTHWGPHNVLTQETLSLKQGYIAAGMQLDSLSTIVQHRKNKKTKTLRRNAQCFSLQGSLGIDNMSFLGNVQLQHWQPGELLSRPDGRSPAGHRSYGSYGQRGVICS